MRITLTALCALLLSIPALAQGPAGVGSKPESPAPKTAVDGNNRTETYLFLADTAACGAGIAFSDNRNKSIEIGVPIWLALNYTAHRIHNNHPKLAHVLQVVSPLGCYAGIEQDRHILSAHTTTPNPPVTGGPKPPTAGGPGGGNGGGTGSSGSGSGSGNTGSGGGSGNGSGQSNGTPPSNGGNAGSSGSGGSTGSGGSGSGAGNGGSGSGGNSGSGSGGSGSGSGGSGNGGGNGSGNGGNGGGGGKGNGGICIQDCGIPGNGGVNGGNDGNKPPFPGQGPGQTPGTGNGKHQ